MPHLQDCNPPLNSKARLKNSLSGIYPQVKERESPKESFLNFYQMLSWLLLGLYSTKNREIRNWCKGPTQP